MKISYYKQKKTITGTSQGPEQSAMNSQILFQVKPTRVIPKPQVKHSRNAKRSRAQTQEDTHRCLKNFSWMIPILPGRVPT